MLRGLLTLLLFQGLGEAIAHFSGIPIPGPVIGMILLFLALQLRNQELPSGLGEAGHFLIRWLSLMFIPACVGFFFLASVEANQWFAIAGVVVLATLVTMIATALLMKYVLMKHSLIKQQLKSEGPHQ
jgi:holin-like protein